MIRTLHVPPTDVFKAAAENDDGEAACDAQGSRLGFKIASTEAGRDQDFR
jgi:hypothetical protein